MKLKCIGGHFHNQYYETGRNYRFGDQIRIPIPKEFEITNYISNDPTIIAIKYEYYILDSFNAKDENDNILKFKYLKQIDMTIPMVLELLFK